MKPLIARLSPSIDITLIVLFSYYSPCVANLIGPLLGWQKVVDFNLFTVLPLIVGIGLASCPIILSLVGFYGKNNLQRPSRAAGQILYFTVICLSFIAFYQSRQPRPSIMNHTLMVNMVGVPILLFVRFYIFRLLQLKTSLGQGFKNRVLLISAEGTQNKNWLDLPAQWRSGYQLVGSTSIQNKSSDELQALIEETHPHLVLIFGDRRTYVEESEIITLCELQGIDIYIPDKSHATPFTRSSIMMIDHHRMLVVSSTPEHSWKYLLKHLLDKILASVALICSLPIWIVAAIIIKISDPKGPIFYFQERSGRYGKPFKMWKFRSMYSDAEQRLEEVKKKYGNEMEGPIFKLTNDPRIIPIGHFLRKTSIDELPQLINVLMGDMSIVGPRPLPLYETKEFPNISDRRRLCVKPGITCYWQVEDRSSNPDFDQMIRQDLRYIDNWSLWLDVCLFFRTIPSVLLRRGAK